MNKNETRESNEIMKAPINVSVIVIDILQIVEVDLEYTAKFKMILEWFDYRYWTIFCRLKLLQEKLSLLV